MDTLMNSCKGDEYAKTESAAVNTFGKDSQGDFEVCGRNVSSDEAVKGNQEMQGEGKGEEGKSRGRLGDDAAT